MIFSLFGQLLSLGGLFKIAEEAQFCGLRFFHLFLQKRFGYTLGDFFTIPSGHPACDHIHKISLTSFYSFFSKKYSSSKSRSYKRESC
jgi:hypothetical protein